MDGLNVPFQSLLTTQILGRHALFFPRTGSTNDVARDLAAQGAPEGTVVVADEQTAGRGRLERRWIAPPGTCLLCSILFRPALALHQAHRLTMLCSLAAADAVAAVSGCAPGIKWPNDLVVLSDGRVKKLAGLLTETGLVGERLDFVVVGVGLNVNVSPGDLAGLAPDATSLLAEVGAPVDRWRLLAAMLAGIETRYAAVRAGQNPRDEWALRLVTIGQRVRATAAGAALVGLAEGVDEEGALLLRSDDGTVQRLLAGDVTLAGKV